MRTRQEGKYLDDIPPAIRTIINPCSTQLQPIVIGIAGGTGSGKTTVAQAILETRVGADRIAYLPHDAYYNDLGDLPPEPAQRDQLRPPRLRSNRPAHPAHPAAQARPARRRARLRLHQTHTRTDQTRAGRAPAASILVEGILIFADPDLRHLFDVKIFVDTDADIRFIRRLQRDINERGRTTESVIHQYLTTVRPMHLEFVEPSKRYADVIIPEGGLQHGRPGYGRIAHQIPAG